MTVSKIILPEAARETRPPELKEGITPPEYMGEDMDLSVKFDQSRHYGLWCMKDSPHSIKMFTIMEEFIPVEFKEGLQKIETELGEGGSADPLAQRRTVGWKYGPVYHDDMGGT